MLARRHFQTILSQRTDIQAPHLTTSSITSGRCRRALRLGNPGQLSWEGSSSGSRQRVGARGEPRLRRPCVRHDAQSVRTRTASNVLRPSDWLLFRAGRRWSVSIHGPPLPNLGDIKDALHPTTSAARPCTSSAAIKLTPRAVCRLGGALGLPPAAAPAPTAGGPVRPGTVPVGLLVSLRTRRRWRLPPRLPARARPLPLPHRLLPGRALSPDERMAGHLAGHVRVSATVKGRQVLTPS